MLWRDDVIRIQEVHASVCGKVVDKPGAHTARVEIRVGDERGTLTGGHGGFRSFPRSRGTKGESVKSRDHMTDTRDGRGRLKEGHSRRQGCRQTWNQCGRGCL